ncbi:MAG: carboxypeptidase-like regulatory domain-containing protein, partial [Saprospiraceae bacterium]|nr:carboxypeptidase-like regulatory domain-containing protein [Saprospiraceae bacterium]
MRPAITLYFVLFIGSLWASNGNRIEGKVLDGATHSPLAGATVFLEGPGLQAITDQLGTFRFDRLSPGSYRLTVRFLGYAVNSRELKVPESESTTLITVPLEP